LVTFTIESKFAPGACERRDKKTCRLQVAGARTFTSVNKREQRFGNLNQQFKSEMYLLPATWYLLAGRVYKQRGLTEISGLRRNFGHGIRNFESAGPVSISRQS
jgi:hypothetical protein